MLQRLSSPPVWKPGTFAQPQTATHFPGPLQAPVVVEVETSLTKADERQLAQCEKVIAAGLQIFFEVGQALCTIRSRRLYRGQYETFEDYCRRRWDMSRFYAYRLIGAAGVMQRLLTIGNMPLPANEAQARPLTRVEPELIPTVWRKALEYADGTTVCHRHVLKAVAQVKAREPVNGSNGRRHAVERSYSKDIARGLIHKMERAIRADKLEDALLLIERLRLAIQQMQHDNSRRSSPLDGEGENE